MKVKVSGQVLNVHQGKSKKTGKEYRYIDFYDGNDMMRVFNPPADVSVGELVEFDCRLPSGNDGVVSLFYVGG